MEVTISIPKKQFMVDSPERAAAKIKLYAALGLYQAGLDRYAFLELCKREGITLRTQTPNELDAEFRHLISEN